MEILKYNDLPQGGFAGLLERQFVTDSKVFGKHKNPKAFNGIGNFVYLADANFNPNGQTGMHGHKEIDVISVMVAGNISHAGSLEHGKSISAGTVQVQRAGSEGFAHNEINPDNSHNQMIQLWVTPEYSGAPAGYKVYQPKNGEMLKIYGGSPQQSKHFDGDTAISVANAKAGDSYSKAGKVMAYLSKGEGEINGEKIAARTLVKSHNGVDFTATTDAQIIFIYIEKS